MFGEVVSIVFGSVIALCIVVGAISLAVLLFKAAFFNKKR